MARAHVPAAAAAVGCSLALLLALLPAQVQGHALMYKPTPRNWLAYLAGNDWCPHCWNGGSRSRRSATHCHAMCPAAAAVLLDGPSSPQRAPPAAKWTVSDNEKLLWPAGRHSLCGEAYNDATRYMRPGPIQGAPCSARRSRAAALPRAWPLPAQPHHPNPQRPTPNPCSHLQAGRRRRGAHGLHHQPLRQGERGLGIASASAGSGCAQARGRRAAPLPPPPQIAMNVCPYGATTESQCRPMMRADKNLR